MMVVRSFCLFGSTLCFLCGFALMLTYLIRRRCDTLPHYGGNLSCHLLKYGQTSVLHLETFQSLLPMSFRHVAWCIQALCAVCACVCLWVDRSPRASCHSFIVVTARHLQRPTRSSPEFFRADVYNRGKQIVFRAYNATACIVHFFTYDIGTCVFCTVGLNSELTGLKWATTTESFWFRRDGFSQR